MLFLLAVVSIVAVLTGVVGLSDPRASFWNQGLAIVATMGGMAGLLRAFELWA